MSSFFAKQSGLKVLLAALALAIASVSAQTDSATVASVLPKKNQMNFQRYNPQGDALDNLAGTNKTAVGPAGAGLNEYLPKTLPTWPSVLSNIMSIGGNILGLNPNLDNTTFFPMETRAKVYPKNGQFPMRVIVQEIINVLTNTKSFKAPIMYNNTILMNDIPNYLQSQFVRWGKDMDASLSDLVNGNAYIDNVDKESSLDAKFLVTKGSDLVAQYNATMNSNNFYDQKLPNLMIVSQMYDKRMNDTVDSLTRVRDSLAVAFGNLRNRLAQRSNEIFNNTVALARDVQVIWNQTEAFVKDFTDTIRARNVPVSNSFETAYLAQCVPSSDLLDAAVVTLNEAVAVLPVRAAYIKTDANAYINAAMNEMDSKTVSVSSTLRRAVTCINGINTDHGAKIRVIGSTFFSTPATQIKGFFTQAYASINALNTQADTLFGLQSAGLQALATAADSPVKTTALGKLLNESTPLLAELSSAFLGKNSVTVMSMPLNLNVLAQEGLAKEATYNPFKSSPPVPYVRKVIPKLADDVDNTALADLAPGIGNVVIPTYATSNAPYLATQLASSRSDNSVFLPMCYTADFITNNWVQSVMPHRYGIYSAEFMLDGQLLTSAPLVNFKINFPGPIPPVQFKFNPKTMVGAAPTMPIQADLNGVNNLVRSVSMQSTPMGVKAVLMVGDDAQFQSLLRQPNKPNFSITVVADEKPFA